MIQFVLHHFTEAGWEDETKKGHSHPGEGSSLDPLESGMGGGKQRVSVTEPGQVLDAAGLRKASLRG